MGTQVTRQPTEEALGNAFLCLLNQRGLSAYLQGNEIELIGLLNHVYELFNQEFEKLDPETRSELLATNFETPLSERQRLYFLGRICQAQEFASLLLCAQRDEAAFFHIMQNRAFRSYLIALDGTDGFTGLTREELVRATGQRDETVRRKLDTLISAGAVGSVVSPQKGRIYFLSETAAFFRARKKKR